MQPCPPYHWDHGRHCCGVVATIMWRWLLVLRDGGRVVTVLMEDENDDDLIDCLSQYLLNHVNSEQQVHLLVGLTIEQDWSLGRPGPMQAQARQRYPR